MARIQTPAPQEGISCNVVPLLDVMFLLLLFLMVGSDMSHSEAAALDLPHASEAKEPETLPERQVVLNVCHAEGACDAQAAGRVCGHEPHWRYVMSSKEFAVDEIAARVESVRSDALEAAGGDGRVLSAVTMTIRADRGSPFGLVQRALESCAAAGIYRTEVAARTDSD